MESIDFDGWSVCLSCSVSSTESILSEPDMHTENSGRNGLEESRPERTAFKNQFRLPRREVEVHHVEKETMRDTLWENQSSLGGMYETSQGRHEETNTPEGYLFGYLLNFKNASIIKPFHSNSVVNEMYSKEKAEATTDSC
jgi:hypothetical protein